ncbi:MAG: response regulator [candidate division NC10 bacterium]|nr:response regulator [candidate division NC10 bacterium]
MLERILVVDDEATNRHLLEAILVEDGFRVELAADALAALRQATAHPPDLILLDLLMPGMSGLEACQRLRQNPKTGGVPIIVVTAVGQIVTKEAALTSGADDFVTKPIRPEDLRTRVAAMLRVCRIQEELGRTLSYLHELEAARHAQRKAALARAVANPTRPATPVPILLVDDEPVSRQFFADLLTEQGFHVLTADSGPAGLDLATRHPIEAAVLDVVMPGMSGLEVLERLRADRPDLPVLMLTGYPGSQYSLAALRMGAFDFITKGLSLSLVILAVHRAVRFRRERLEMRAEIDRLRARIAELERCGTAVTVRTVECR